MKEDKEEKNNEEKKSAWREELEKRQKIDRKKEMQKPEEDLAKGAGRAVDKSGFTRNRRSTQGGGSTIEILVAFVVITLALTAVVMVIFGNQSFAIDTKVTQRALYHAERGVEHAFASSTDNFSSLASFSISLTDLFGGMDADEIYADDKIGVKVTPISECVKMVESGLHWNYSTGNRARAASTTSIFVSTTTSAALGGDCDTTGLSDPWDNPGTLDSDDIGGQGATDLDVLNGYIYLTSNKFPPLNNSDLFVYSFDETTGVLSYENEIDIGEGLNAIDVAGNYAFVASASTTGQLQVIDITNPVAPSRVESATRNLPGVDPAGSFPQGWSIAYYNDRIYIGTRETGGTPPPGPEFHIFDVSLPTNPTPLGSLELTHHVNDIYISDSFAYIASSDNSRELMIVDVSDPSNLKHPDDTGLGFDAPGQDDGTAVYKSGNRIYLGRMFESPGHDPDFWILDMNDVLDGADSTDGVLGSKDLGLQNNSFVTGIVVKGFLAFIGMDDPNSGLQIWNVSSPSDIKPPSACGIFNFAENGTGIDMEGDYVFTSNDSNAEIRVIYDQPTTCS